MLRAVTFDFWSTLVDGTPTPERTAERVARLHRAIVGAGHACTAAELQMAFEEVTRRLDDPWRESFEDVGPPGRWAALALALGVPEGVVPFEVVERAYEDITLNPVPPIMPHVRQAVDAVRKMGYRTAVICNTGMAGGSVLREVLRRHELLDCFDATVFSNEFGVAKPDARIFAHTLAELGGIAPEQALHVGDIEYLDVRGARNAGLHSALYAPEQRAESAADFVVRDWREFASQLDAFAQDVMPG